MWEVTLYLDDVPINKVPTFSAKEAIAIGEHFNMRNSDQEAEPHFSYEEIA